MELNGAHIELNRCSEPETFSFGLRYTLFGGEEEEFNQEYELEDASYELVSVPGGLGSVSLDVLDFETSPTGANLNLGITVDVPLYDPWEISLSTIEFGDLQAGALCDLPEDFLCVDEALACSGGWPTSSSSFLLSVLAILAGFTLFTS